MPHSILLDHGFLTITLNEDFLSVGIKKDTKTYGLFPIKYVCSMTLLVKCLEANFESHLLINHFNQKFSTKRSSVPIMGNSD